MAEATVRGALARTETRGCHIRRDRPELDPRLQVNLVTRAVVDPDGDGMVEQPRAEAIPEWPAEWQPWIDESAHYPTEGRLLE